MSENIQQLNLFNFDKEFYKIKKPIRLIELFAGIGAQAKALEILGVPFEHYKICEWAAPSIRAYNAIHIKDTIDYSKDKTKQELIDYLKGNISTNYNDPCNVERQSESWLRDIYNNCIATHNLMNIMKVKGKDLEIVDTEKYEYIMTYSFPCQDLSLAGTRKGMATSQADGGTRSGLLWEVERILDELENKPQILLMENVPEVIGKDNVKHFNKWLAKLESLGYSNYFQILNGKDYCIPQNRRRVFMISILGDYAYDFPLKHKLKYRLKDFLEKQVDEKYYLSDKMIEFFSYNTEKQKESGNGVKCKTISADDESASAKTITTRNGSRMDDNFVADKCEQVGNMNYYNHEQSDRVYGAQGCAPTLRTGHDEAKAIKVVDESRERENGIMVKENNSIGYKVATPGDGVNLANRMKHQRGNVQKGSIQTLKTEMEIGVVVDEQDSD